MMVDDFLVEMLSDSAGECELNTLLWDDDEWLRMWLEFYGWCLYVVGNAVLKEITGGAVDADRV